MADEYNPADHKTDADQGNPERAKDGVHESQTGAIQQPDAENKGDAADKPVKPAVLVRLWHALWRKRIFFRHHHAGGPNWAEKTSMYITGGILIATVIQALIYWKQAGIMEHSLEQNQQTIALNTGQLAIAGRNARTAENTLAEMKSGGTDTHDLAVAAKGQADRTKDLAKQAVTANSILSSVQRAFVIFIPDTTDLRPYFVNGVLTSYRYQLRAENAGTTPTRDMTFHVQARWFPIPFTLDKSFPFDDMDYTGNKCLSETQEGCQHIPTLLGPKGQSPLGVMVVPINIIERLNNHTERVFFDGWITYRDIFSNTRLHRTYICKELMWADMSRFEGDQVALADCPYHNCTDEECGKEDKQRHQ